jgi:hypothetical protein
MNKNTLRKLSPFALGVALGCYQVMQQPLVQAASLGAGSVTSNLTSLAPSIPTTVPASATAGGCSLDPLQQAPQGGALPSQGSAELGTAPSSLGYQSMSVAEASVAPVSNSTNATLMAQLVPDENCCEFGGTADCELGGLPPVGGAAVAGFPFAALAGLAPAALIPLIPGGGDGGDGGGENPPPPPPPVPEPSSTAGIVAGFGMLALWFGRRLRTGQNSSV